MKMYKNIILIPALMILLTARMFAFEKVGTTSFQFLKVIPGARGTALAGAFCTLANNSEAVFWNPAGLYNVKNFDVSFSYVQWFMDIKHYAFSAAYNMGNLGVIGIQAIATDVGDIEVTRVDRLGFVNGVYNPGLTGEVFRPNSYVIGLSYARNLTDRFAFGITAKYIQENLVYAKSEALAFDAGFVYNTGFRSVVIGASIRHFGQEVKFIDKSFPMPQTFNVGISAYLFAPDESLISDLGNHKLLATYDMVQPRDYDQLHSAGLEYTFNDFISLRGGYIFNGDQEGITAGVGLNYKNYRFDYSYNDYGSYLGPVHRLTLGFEL